MHLPGGAGREGSLLASSGPVEGTQEDIQQPGDRHPEERAENAPQLGADQERRHGHQWMNAGGGTHHPRSEDVGLDGVSTDGNDQG